MSAASQVTVFRFFCTPVFHTGYIQNSWRSQPHSFPWLTSHTACGLNEVSILISQGNINVSEVSWAQGAETESCSAGLSPATGSPMES